MDKNSFEESMKTSKPKVNQNLAKNENNENINDSNVCNNEETKQLIEKNLNFDQNCHQFDEKNLSFDQIINNLENLIKNSVNWMKNSTEYEQNLVKELDVLIEESIAVKHKITNESKVLSLKLKPLTHLMTDSNNNQFNDNFN
jgi:translation initiation factor 2B subunit (eIF-2B alpha/beta/delta family)